MALFVALVHFEQLTAISQASSSPPNSTPYADWTAGASPHFVYTQGRTSERQTTSRVSSSPGLNQYPIV